MIKHALKFVNQGLGQAVGEAKKQSMHDRRYTGSSMMGS
jgi:hypothetical protein